MHGSLPVWYFLEKQWNSGQARSLGSCFSSQACRAGHPSQQTSPEYSPEYTAISIQGKMLVLHRKCLCNLSMKRRCF